MKVRRNARAVRLLLMAVAFASLSAVPSPAADPPVVDQTGYWSATGGTLVPGVTPAAPPPPNVPAGSIPVSATAGQTTAVAAVGIVLGLAPGSTVTKLTLSLRPAGAPGSDSSSAVTAIRACPITVFWAGVENGPLEQAPPSDCATSAAPGTRGTDGTWTFDLTAVAAMWADAAGTLAMNGVLLQPSPEPAGQTFSVAFATGSGIVATIEATAPPPDMSTSDTTEPVTDTTSAPSFGGGAGGVDATVPIETPVEPTTVATSPPAPPPGEPLPVETAAPIVTPRADGPGTIGGWPLGVFVAVALAIVLAGLASLTLGLRPEDVGEHREGGLSRALAAHPTTMEVR